MVSAQPFSYPSNAVYLDHGGAVGWWLGLISLISMFWVSFVGKRSEEQPMSAMLLFSP